MFKYSRTLLLQYLKVLSVLEGLDEKSSFDQQK